MDATETSKPGPWSNDFTPHLVAVMDASSLPGVESAGLLKGVQNAGTTGVQNAILSWIYQSPRDVLYVLPDEDTSRKQSGRLKRMIENTPLIADQMTGQKRDMGQRELRMKRMRIVPAWAGSEASLASDPFPVAIFDEADKYPVLDGQDPIALGRKRQTTYEGHPLKFEYILSTCTTREGAIWKAWEACPNKLRWHVPCPHCGRYQVITFSRVRWPSREELGIESRAEQAAYIQTHDLARYHCEHCESPISEMERRSILLRGVWAWDGETVTLADIEAERARIERETGRPPARPYNMILRHGRDWPRQIFFHMPSWCGPWVGWSMLAAEWLQAQGRQDKIQDFRNQRQAEPYEQQQASVRRDRFDVLLKRAGAARTVPEWATMLVSTADTQKDHWWYLTRAWGAGFRSQLVDYGRANSPAELIAATVDRPYPIIDASGEPTGATAQPVGCWIDAGGTNDEDDESRTFTVYRMALGHAQLYALRGHGGKKAMVQPWLATITRYQHPDGSIIEVPYLRANTSMAKDVLARRIVTPDDAEDRWDVHDAIGQDYRIQMTSEHKILIRSGRSQSYRWMPIASGADNHLWDTEGYQVTVADYLQVHLMPTIISQHQARAKAAAQTATMTTINPYTGRPYGQF